MSWRTAASSSSSEGADSSGRRRWSIGRRLGASYILVTILSYVVFGLYFYQERAREVQRILYKGISDEELSVRRMLVQTSRRDVLVHLSLELSEPDPLRPLVRILDNQGKNVVETPGMGAVVPASAFAAAPFGPVTWRNPEGSLFLLRSAVLTDDIFCGHGGSMQIGINIDEEMQLLEQMRVTLIAGICCALAFAFLATFIIARLALKPVQLISDTALQISGNDFQKRIDESQLPVELVSLASSFNSMLSRISQSFEQLSHYSANLAHELRTPINSMVLEAEVTLSKERSPEEYRTVIGSTLDELGRLSRTIDRLLFIARVDLQHEELPMQLLDAREEAEDVLDYFHEAAKEAGVELMMEQGTVQVFADQTLLRRAISNLVSNAIAYTGRGGAVSVSFAALEDGRVTVTVTDTGSGIGKEHLARIFDRFYRVPRKDRAKGSTGLGLAIVKAIMIMHRGEASIESDPGVGTSVTLTFPPPPSHIT